MPAAAPVVLRCRVCGRPAPVAGPQWCEGCFGPVEVVLDAAGWPGALGHIAAGPASWARYLPWLPEGLDAGGARAGAVPLRPARTLGAAVGLDDLWLFDETVNPTGSFKDRVVELALARSAPRGATVVAASSTGNLARAVAAAAPRWGARAVLVVPEAVPGAERDALARAGAVVVVVRGGYDAAARLATELEMARPGWGWVNGGLRPWYELGALTAGWEMAEASQWSLPDRVVAPVASGAYLLGLHRAHRLLVEAGVSAGPVPRVTVAQPEGCAPVARALVDGSGDVRPVRPATRAASVAMGDPPDGPELCAVAVRTGGAGVVVPEAEIEPAVGLVEACEGLAVDPAVAVAVAGLRRLCADGVVAPGERVVLAVTGSGGRGAGAGAGTGARVAGGRVLGTIDPSLEAIEAVLPPELSER